MSKEGSSLLVKLFHAAKDVRERALAKLGRGARALPWLSLVYGIVSGVYLTRDYAHSTQLLFYLALAVVVQGSLRLALFVAERRAGHLALVQNLAQRPDLVQGLALGAQQYAVQYILMYCIPLLFVARAWVTFGLAVLAVATTLWDTWWLKLARNPLYTSAMRTLAATLAASFAFAVVFPARLSAFYPTLGAVAVLAAVPWDELRRKRLRIGFLPFLPAVVVLAAVGVQVKADHWLRFPLLSVGLRGAGLGVGIQDRELVERLPRSVPRARFAELALRGDELCCLTPIVSPSGLTAPVTHEWRFDGLVGDRINLPPVRGRGDAGSFRTFSCKKHLPTPATLREVECIVLLDGTIRIGHTRLVVQPTAAATTP